MSLSYPVTEAYRLRLISQRERAARGAWDTIPFLDENCIPLCQFDNWDILPLHAVKVDGKANPKVNGSLVQGLARKRKRKVDVEEGSLSEHLKRQRLQWEPVSRFGNRFDFANSFTSARHTKVLEEFYAIVFGLTTLHRDKLLGQNGTSSAQSESSQKNRIKSGSGPVNFRSLLLSAFKPHGGACQEEEGLYDQHVVYIDISRENAASILTVQRTIDLIKSLVRPGSPGCPRFIVFSGDQPSYKMLAEPWLTSWRDGNSKNSRNAGSLQLHEWLIPFPGFFHGEKQSLYSLGKEMLDGTGLSELAKCVGLSIGQVENILKHSHARNNRALLFSLACALVIHAVDKVLDENPKLNDEVSAVLTSNSRSKKVSTATGAPVEYVQNGNQAENPTSSETLLSKTINVPPEIFDMGKKLHKAVASDLCEGPNGKHFIGTILLGALLPTIGFHVLSRTGHTDIIEAFWFRLTYLLHASNHLKYQELSLFYAFLRGITPDAVVKDLFNNVPGTVVAKLPSFTGNWSGLLDRRGWTYVHLDELLEMLIVRQLKSLSVNFLSHLENAAAWLMQVSHFRSLARRVRGAARAYGRSRGADDSGEEQGPLSFYNRNAPQHRTLHGHYSRNHYKVMPTGTKVMPSGK